MSDAEINASTSVYLMLIEMTARTLAGPDASLTSYERTLIEGPLKRTLKKYGGVSEKLSSIADPVALIFGLTMYGARVMQARAAMEAPAPRRVTEGAATGAGAPPPPGVPPIQQPLGPLATFVPAPDSGPGEMEMLDAAD